MRKRIAAGVAVAVVLMAGVVWTSASPAVGVTPTVLARGTYDPFKIKPGSHSQVDFKGQAKSALDVVVRTHDYLPGSSTGWHTHPGPVFITVTKGQLTVYEVDDPTCSPKTLNVGEGYFDSGHGHIARNETAEAAQDFTVFFAPVGGALRGELPAPGPYCSF